jgi:hypothetical protein
METSVGLSSLPPEVLLLIAEFVVEQTSKYPYQITLNKKTPGQALLALSAVNKSLRRACIESGLFHRITPMSRNFKGYKKFGWSFVQTSGHAA